MNSNLNPHWTYLSTALVCLSLLFASGCVTSPTAWTYATSSAISSTVTSEQSSDSAAINRDDRELLNTWYGHWRCTNLEELGLSELFSIFDDDGTYQSYYRLDDLESREIGTWRFLRTHRLELHITLLDGQPVSEFYELGLRRPAGDLLVLTYFIADTDPFDAEFMRDQDGILERPAALDFGTEVE